VFRGKSAIFKEGVMLVHSCVCWDIIILAPATDLTFRRHFPVD
jgi:hypothetical protein